MRPDGTPDLASLTRLLEHVLGQGVTGVLMLGSTGENGCLSPDERESVLGHAVEIVAGRVHVMAGVAALGSKESIAYAARYAALGADSLLVPPAYGFPLSYDELKRHFASVAAAAPGVPLVAYNVPGRFGVTLGPDLMAELGADSTISGIKDSSGDVQMARKTSEATRHLAHFRRYTGSEECIDAKVLGGFHGSVPGLANPFGDFHARLARQLADGDWGAASMTQGQIVRLSALYDGRIGGGGFSASAIGAMKEGLVQQGVIEFSATSPQFEQVDDSLRAHVATIVALAKELAA